MKVKKSLQEPLDKIYTYLLEDEKYKQTLELLLNKKELDLVIVTLWKVFMYFLYQRLNEVDNDKLTTAWKDKFNKDLEKEINLDNFYWPNEIRDDKVITFLKELYPLENNTLKVVRGMLALRNSCAHVTGNEVQEINVDNYLSNMFEVLKLIEEVHLREKSILIKRLLSQIENSGSFASTNSLLIELTPLAKKFEIVDIKEFIISTINNRQVRDADGTEPFLLKLYQANDVDSDLWEKIGAVLEKNLGDQYFSKLRNKIFNDNMPF